LKTKEEIERLAEAEIKLSYFQADQIRNSMTYFGYPEVPENNDLSILGISGLAKLHLNNAGDPWIHGNAKMHTKDFEQEALDFVANLYGIKDNYWGYVTSGGTESNLYGSYMSRDFFKNKSLEPLLIFSEETHYSVAKNAHLLGLNTQIIDTLESGEINYEKLSQLLATLDAKTAIIINLNLGTTMKGAYDNLNFINEALEKNNIPKERVHIHADAALTGFIYPFIRESVDLFLNGVTSIAISGHKFPGAIHPCGIVLVKKDLHAKAFGDQWVPYVGTNDTTISGSRNGFLALNLWYIFSKKGLEGFRKEALQCIKNAEYLKEQLLEMNYQDVSMFPGQPIVVFKKPSQKIVEKYQLATQGELAHVVVMQHITPSRIDTFCDALKTSVV